MARVRTSPDGSAKATSPGVRKLISAALDEQATGDAIKEILERALSSEVDAVAVCVDCGGRMKVRIGDVKKQVETLVAFIEQAEGRPAANQPEATTIVIVRPPL